MTAQRQLATFNNTGFVVVGAVETLVATSLNVVSPYPGAVFSVLFHGYLTMGADQTGAVLNIRRGSVGGQQILTTDVLARTAGTVSIISAIATDTIAGEAASLVYVLTVTQSGGVANGQAKNIYSAVVGLT